MKKILLPSLVFLVLLGIPAQGGILEDMWNKYAPAGRQDPAREERKTPGRILGALSEERETIFAFPWRYRSLTYELHYEDSEALARTVYGIALHAGDIDRSLDPEKFVGGVLGYHYKTQQICDWLNAVGKKNVPDPAPDPAMDELLLVGLLLQDRIIGLENGRFSPSGTVSHVLAAAPGKKRPFSVNLRHERMHIYWDEDDTFREKAMHDWEKLSGEEKEQALKKFSRYAKNNERQMIEEWAISRAESSSMSLE
jgi:hypothetical protein